MIVYELRHLFYRCEDEVIYSPKKLGIFYSHEDAVAAIRTYSAKQGFSENQDCFSLRERMVSGKIENGNIYEVCVYYHDINYCFEADVELGLFSSEVLAIRALRQYCDDNTLLINAQGIQCEQIVNRWILGSMDWMEGFVLDV